MRLRKISLLLFAGLLSIVMFSSAFAADSAPLALMKRITKQAMQQLSTTKPNTKQRARMVTKVVNKLVGNYVAMNAISAAVVGQTWKTTSSAKRAEFKKIFRRYVVRTYRSALEVYQDEKVRFRPMGNIPPSSKMVQVRSVIFRRNGTTIPVDYWLIKRGDKWKVYDLNVEGVSMIRSYRSQFAAIIKNKGLSALIQTMNKPNR